jgi:branched-chain amino acid transport system permease protein
MRRSLSTSSSPAGPASSGLDGTRSGAVPPGCERVVTTVVNGLLLGANYALLALGYSLIFGVMRLLTLAHGQVFVAAGVLALLAAEWGVPVWLALLLALAIGAVLSIATDYVSFRPVGYAHPIAAAVSTIGFAFVIAAWLQQIRGSGLAVVLPLDMPDTDITIGSVLISAVDLTTLVVAAIVTVAAMRFITTSKWGLAMRAFAHDPDAVALLGIPVRRVVIATLAIAGGLAGLAVVLLVVRHGSIDPGVGFEFGLVGLAVMTIGGIGNLRGALIAGLVLGVAQTLLDGFAYQAAVPWMLLVAVLVFRPQGLFGGQAL